MIDGIKGKITGISPEAFRRRLDINTAVNDNRLPVVIAGFLKVCGQAFGAISGSCLKNPPILKYIGYCQGKTAAM